jgi:hypothetical protein
VNEQVASTYQYDYWNRVVQWLRERWGNLRKETHRICLRLTTAAYLTFQVNNQVCAGVHPRREFDRPDAELLEYLD